MSAKIRPSVNPAKQPAAGPAWLRTIVLASYFLPGLIGLCVWFYLRMIGKPVMAVSWVVRMVPALAVFSALWVLPFVAVFLVARRLPLANQKFLGLVCGAFLGTALTEILVFGYAWTNVEMIVMGFVLLPIAVFGGTLVGGAIGFLTGWLLPQRNSR